MSGLGVLSICHGCFALGLGLVVILRYLKDERRTHILLIGTSYLLMTFGTVRAMVLYGTNWNLQVAIYLAAWILGDAGMIDLLIRGEVKRRLEASR